MGFCWGVRILPSEYPVGKQFLGGGFVKIPLTPLKKSSYCGPLMTLTLTFREAKDIVCTHLHLPHDVEVKIMEPEKELEKELEKEPEKEYRCDEVVKAIERLMVDPHTGLPILVDGKIPPSEKAAACKRLRTMIPNLGLINAKHAVESWETFIEYVREYGIPPVHGSVWSTWGT